jgi:glycosyltransferase involved in cell wall biosynthesis
LIYRKATGIIFQTSRAREFFQNLEKHISVRVIGNPVREIPKDPGVIKENIILTVGRLIPSKNHDKLIESFLRINKSGWKLVIAGGDALNMTLMKNLTNLVSKLGAEKKIVLTGNISNVDHFYMKSKIFVLTSESEGFPNVIGEAMSAGLPVVAFDCVAGPSEMITDGKDGFLIPVSDYGSLEQKLVKLIDDSALRDRIGREAVNSIKNFSVEKIGEEYYSFIFSDQMHSKKYLPLNAGQLTGPI